MTDAWRPPEAPLLDEPEGARRPVGVWIVSIFYGLTTLSSAITTPLLMSGSLPVPAEQQQQLEMLGPLRWVSALAGVALMAAFVVQLFRLRASAVWLCAALLLFSLGNGAWQLLRAGMPPEPFGSVALLGSLFSLSVLLAIWLYTLWLRRRGVLR